MKPDNRLGRQVPDFCRQSHEMLKQSVDCGQALQGVVPLLIEVSEINVNIPQLAGTTANPTTRPATFLPCRSAAPPSSPTPLTHRSFRLRSASGSELSSTTLQVQTKGQ